MRDSSSCSESKKSRTSSLSSTKSTESTPFWVKDTQTNRVRYRSENQDKTSSSNKIQNSSVVTMPLTSKKEPASSAVQPIDLTPLFNELHLQKYHSEIYDNTNRQQQVQQVNHWDELYANAPKNYWPTKTEKKDHVADYVKRMLKDRDEQRAMQKEAERKSDRRAMETIHFVTKKEPSGRRDSTLSANSYESIHIYANNQKP